MSEYKYPGYGPTRENWLTSRPKTKFGYHGGNDNPAPAGTPVYAQYDGTVFRSGNINGYGLAVVVRTRAPNGTVFYTLYGHLAPQDLPTPDTPIAAGQPIPGAFIGTKEDVRRLGGLSSGPHLHREIISGNAPLRREPNERFGIYSSDITHKADPDAFDINNPVFPYENNEPKPPPQPAPTESPQVQPSRHSRQQPSRDAPQPAVPTSPQQNGERNPSPQLRPTPSVRSPQLQPSRPDIGPPLDITPRLGPAAPGPGAAGPAPIPDGLPPLHFAPETPRRFGPFEMPGLIGSDVFDGPRLAPGADVTGNDPSNPPPSFGTPGTAAPPTSSAASGMADQIGDGNGIGDWWKGIAPAASSNVDPSSFGGLASPIPGMVAAGLSQPSQAAVTPLGFAGGAPTHLLHSGNAVADWWNGLVAGVDAVNQRNGFGRLDIPMPNNVPTPPAQPEFDGGLPGMLQRAGAFDPSAGGLLRLLQEHMRNNPDDDVSA